MSVDDPDADGTGDAARSEDESESDSMSTSSGSETGALADRRGRDGSKYDQFLEALVQLHETAGPWEGGWPTSDEYELHRPDWAPSVRPVYELEAFTGWREAVDVARGLAHGWTEVAIGTALQDAAAATPGPDSELRCGDYRLYRATTEDDLPPIAYLSYTIGSWQTAVSAADLEPQGEPLDDPGTFDRFLQALRAIWRRDGEPPTAEYYNEHRPERAPAHTSLYDVDSFTSWKDALEQADMGDHAEDDAVSVVQQAAEETPGAADSLSCLDYCRYRRLPGVRLPAPCKLAGPTDWTALLDEANLTPAPATRPLPSSAYGQLVDGIITIWATTGSWPTVGEYIDHKPDWAPWTQNIHEGDVEGFKSWSATIADAHATACDRVATAGESGVDFAEPRHRN